MFKSLPQSRVLKQIARANLIAGTLENAFVLNPSKFKRVELLVIQKNIHEPAIGLRKFWKENLPVLQFHNNDIEFAVTRIKVNNKDEVKQCPIKILVTPVGSEAKLEIDCAHLNQSKILKKLVKLTGATPVAEEDIPKLRAPQGVVF